MKGLIKCLLLVFVLFYSCGKEKNTNKDDSQIRFNYYNLENAGWKSRLHSQQVDNVHFTATEVPIQYYLLKDQGNEDLIKVDSIYQQNKTERIIEFTFHDDNEEDLLLEKFTQMDYESAVKYMSFEIQNDFVVVTSKNDTIKCSGALFERSFKVAPFNKIMLFFSNISPNEKIQLVYNDYLFRKGTLKFRFKDPILKL